MRVLFILFFSMTLSFYCKGQITVTNSNFVETGDVVSGFQLDANLPDPGNSGANQTWDFSNVTGTETQNFEYVDPQSSPNFADFPSSNLVLLSPMGSYFYEENDGDNWLLHGLVQSAINPNDGIFKYTPAHFNAKFPMNYNDTYTHSYEKDFLQNGNAFLDSLTGKYTAHVNSHIDGWGTITTPLGTYSCLREHIQEQDSVTLYTYIGGNVDSVKFVINIDSYVWWSEDVSIKFPVATHVVTDFEGGGTFFTYNDPGALTNSQNEIEISTIEIFPNPTNGILHFKNPQLYTTLDIYNLYGEKISSHPIKNKNVVYLSDFAIGNYILIFKTEEGNFFVSKVVTLFDK